MTILAFDVSKHELVGVRADKNGAVKENFVLPNTPKEINTFLRSAKKLHPKIIMGSEATAEYHREIAKQACDLKIPFRLINPILTKQFTRSTIRKRKTDKTDAAIIAKLIANGEGTLLTKRSLDSLKPLHRTANSINVLKKTLAAMLAHLQQISPEETTIHEEIRTAIDLLEHIVIQIRSHVQKHTDPTLKKLLMTIPGIGETIAATLIAEIETIERFSNANKLVAFAGLDPRVRQSGVSLNRNTKLTKRGSPHLRQSAFIAAYIAARHDPELKKYFEKKMKEGKRYKEATVATARKILYRVFAVWKRGTPYEKRNDISSEKNVSKKLST
ncbi:MAG: IS110 family transposase [Candidatus Kerfeldbacteria bacterium]|nr:IS110 family transposase [Candidatus Kerfeldbacteria bacterium]